MDAIRSVLGLDMPGSFLAEGRLFVLQTAHGDSPLDAVLLVVTAEDGVTETVRQELRHSQEAAPVPVVAFLDGCDRVPDGQGFVLDLIELELRGLAADLGIPAEALAVLRGSSRAVLGEKEEDAAAWSAPIHALAAALAAQAAEERGDFRMSIGDLVPVRRGTVVLGRIEAGRVQAGQMLEVSSSGHSRSGRIRGVMRGWDLVPDARAGEEVGLFLEKLRMIDFLGAQILTRSTAQPPSHRGAKTPEPGGPGTFVVPVFYATDRNQTAELTPRLVYGAGRGDLTLGVAEVSLPRSRRPADLPVPPWWRLESDEHLANHVVLLDVSVHDRETYVAALRQTVSRAARPEALVFVHGYNLTFEDAARRTAQLANDLDLPGVPILYSWPSEGRAHRYTVDELNVEWSLPHFEELLRLVLAESGARTVHVVAEGMGNRALARALGALDALDALVPPASGGGASLRQVVFVAPDVDRDTFLGLVPRFAGRAERFTLYSSSRDRALQASRIVHSRPRAGEFGAELIDGIDVIDANDAVDTTSAILNDLAALLRQGLPA
jgi:esterase/lipase superfamily enzyme